MTTCNLASTAFIFRAGTWITSKGITATVLFCFATNSTSLRVTRTDYSSEILTKTVQREACLWSRKSVAKMVTVVVLVPVPVPFHSHSDPTRISVCQGHQNKKKDMKEMWLWGWGEIKVSRRDVFIFLKTEYFTSCYLRTNETSKRASLPNTC